MDGGRGSGVGIRASVLIPKTRRQAKEARDLVADAFVCLLYVLVRAFELDHRSHSVLESSLLQSNIFCEGGRKLFYPNLVLGILRLVARTEQIQMDVIGANAMNDGVRVLIWQAKIHGMLSKHHDDGALEDSKNIGTFTTVVIIMAKLLLAYL